MFPNLRLLIGALAASVTALCCGFGMFAAFRVSHEPLSRLPSGAAPLQLVMNEAATPQSAWNAPVSGLAPLNLSDVAEAAMVRPTISSPVSVAIDTARISMTAAVSTTARVDAPRQHALLPATQTALAKPAAATAPRAALPASAPPPEKVSAASQTASAPPVTVGLAKTSVTPTEMLPAEADVILPAAAANQAGGATPNDSAMAAPAAVAAIDPAPPPARSVASGISLPEARPVAIGERTAAEAEKARKALAKAIERRRMLARRRLVRKPAAAAAAVAQFGGASPTFHEPVFQSAPDFQAGPQARSRSAKKTANSDAPANSFAWPSPE